jgi:hypothetical protein
MFRTPSLQDLVKEAMEGTAHKVDITVEAAQQLVNQGGAAPASVSTPEQEKTASFDLTPNDYIEKLAGALDYLSKEAAGDTAPDGPGKGPNALEVLKAKADGQTFEASGQGKATASSNVPPMSPPMQSSGVAKDPSNAMQTNDGMQHPEQPVDPMANEKTSSVYERNLAALGLAKEAGKVPSRRSLDMQAVGTAAKGFKDKLTGKHVSDVADSVKSQPSNDLGDSIRASAVGKAKKEQTAARLKAGGAVAATGAAATGAAVAGKKAADKKSEGGTEKGASIYERNLAALGLQKVAEDAINPAKIAAGTTQTGATPPEGVSKSEEGVPSEPSDVNSQKTMIGSNQAAIDYTKGKAKKDPQGDASKVLAETAGKGDTTLQQAWAHTGEAGVKVSQDLTRAAAAQALLHKLAEAVCGDKKDDKKKEKQSQMGGLSDPSGQSGFTASSMGG